MAFVVRLLGLVAAFKVALGLAAFAFADAALDPARASSVPPSTNLIVSVLFGVGGLLLARGGSKDERARDLAALLLLVGATYSDRLGRMLTASLGLDGSLPARLHSIQLDAFEPWLLWRFAQQFPRVDLRRGWAALGRAFCAASGLVAVVLFAVESARALIGPWTLSSRLGDVARGLDRRDPDSAYWTVVFLVFTPAVAWIWLRAKEAVGPEQRRAWLFLVAMLAALGPLAVNTSLTSVFPGYRTLLRGSRYEWLVHSLIIACLASLPITTAYAVLVHRVLDVRLVIRRVVQYAMARYALAGGVALPLVAIVGYLARNRDQTVGSLLAGPPVLFLGGASGAAGALLALRTPILESLDRRFFRERYDARRLLSSLARESRRVTRPLEFAALVEVEVERALHPELVAVLVVDPGSGRLAGSGEAMPTLAADSTLAELLRARAAPFDVEPGSPALAGVPEAERRWLEAAGITLLVPLTASEGRLVGLIALGPRKSELPYSEEDRQLLADVADAGAIVVENRLIRAGAGGAAGAPRTPAGAAGSTAERWQRIKGQLADALERDPADRRLLLEQIEARDPEAARELKSLIASYEDADNLIDTSPALYPETLPAGSRVGPFEIRSLIGSGGMGRVYEALDTRLGRDVALKVLASELEDSPSARRRFEREARAVAALSHPNILAIHDYGKAGTLAYVVTELLRGETLRSRIARGPIPVATALEQARQIARGLVAAHAKGIVHRDLKPENLFLTEEGAVKILDFGLAKRSAPGAAASPASSVSRPGMLLGTVGYMAPEQVRGEQADARCDIFSFGSVLYEMVSGRRAFERATAVETMAAILREEPLPLDQPPLPASLAALLRGCLEKSPARRTASAAEVLAALDMIGPPGA